MFTINSMNSIYEEEKTVCFRHFQGSANDDPKQISDIFLAYMHYMNSVIAETQRMYTIEFTDPEAHEDYEYKGIKLHIG